MKYDLTILGAGSGGLVAAATAAGMGARVLLVESRKMGGDCLNYGCVPSKTFLKSAHLMNEVNHAESYGISVNEAKSSLEMVMNRVRSVIAEIAPHDSKERFEGLGVKVVYGHGEIVGRTRVRVGENVYESKSILIATGSKAMIPLIEGLSDVPYYTNETIFGMRELPRRLIVLGGGPIGLELGQGFAHLGSKVELIDRSEDVFGKDEPEVANYMRSVLNRDMNLHMGSQILKVEQSGKEIKVTIQKAGEEVEVIGDALLVALGRTPNTKGMGLVQVGIELDKRGFVVTNDKLQTSIKNIYACGDVIGKYLFTHAASYEAGIAVRNALIYPMFKCNYYNIAWTTYTIPEVAHTGISQREAKELGILGKVYQIDIGENDRAKAEDDRVGYVKVIVDQKQRVIGATIVGRKAGEMIAILSLMVTKKMKLGSLMSVIYQYPIQGEILKSLAIMAFKDSVKPWQQSLVKKIVRR